MSEWKEFRLNELGVVITGKTPSIKFPEEFGLDMPFVTPTDYKNYNKWADKAERYLSQRGIDKLASKVLPSNSLLVTCIGSDMGKVVLNKVPVITNQQINSIIPFNDFDSDFLYYKLIDEYETLRVYGEAGTAVPILNKGDFENILVEIPVAKDEQQTIASILSSLDDKIDLLHRQNKTLEALAETLFRQWFKVHSTTLGKLGSLVVSTFGGEWGKETVEGDYNFPVNCIRGTDIADLQVGLATRTPLRFVKAKKYESIEMQNGDLVMEISGGSDGQSTGRTILINEDVKSLFSYPLVFSNFCRLIRPINPESGLYLLCYINMLYDQGDFFNLENGSSGIRNFDYKAFLYELDYEIHNSTQILNFNEAIRPYFDKINKNKFQIRTLTQLRDTLLPKLMSGEVRVKNV